MLRDLKNFIFIDVKVIVVNLVVNLKEKLYIFNVQVQNNAMKTSLSKCKIIKLYTNNIIFNKNILFNDKQF